MKKTVLFALALCALAATATTASAQAHRPLFDRNYLCDYSSSWTNEKDPGKSKFVSQIYIANPPIIYGIEIFETANGGEDNRRIAFAKWRDVLSVCPPHDPGCVREPLFTRYEFTIANGVQCTTTRVFDYGAEIQFLNCSNGKTRTCRVQ